MELKPISESLVRNIREYLKAVSIGYGSGWEIDTQACDFLSEVILHSTGKEFDEG